MAWPSLSKTLSLSVIYNSCATLTQDEGGSLLFDCLLQAAAASCHSHWYLSCLFNSRHISPELLPLCILHQGHSAKWWRAALSAVFSAATFSVKNHKGSCSRFWCNYRSFVSVKMSSLLTNTREGEHLATFAAVSNCDSWVFRCLLVV